MASIRDPNPVNLFGCDFLSFLFKFLFLVFSIVTTINRLCFSNQNSCIDHLLKKYLMVIMKLNWAKQGLFVFLNFIFFLKKKILVRIVRQGNDVTIVGYGSQVNQQ